MSSYKKIFASILALLLTYSLDANAQLTKIGSIFTSVTGALTAISATVFTLAITVAGYKIAFQGAKWNDVAPIVIGAFLVGGAAGIAAAIL